LSRLLFSLLGPAALVLGSLFGGDRPLCCRFFGQGQQLPAVVK
jgi:hypothetical protein